jgi:hypothetical protein
MFATLLEKNSFTKEPTNKKWGETMKTKESIKNTGRTIRKENKSDLSFLNSMFDQFMSIPVSTDLPNQLVGKSI